MIDKGNFSSNGGTYCVGKQTSTIMILLTTLPLHGFISRLKCTPFCNDSMVRLLVWFGLFQFG